MKRGISAAIVLIVTLGALLPGHAQSLKRVNAKLLYEDGQPAMNQTVLIEGTKQPLWYNAWGFLGDNKVEVRAISDAKGSVQFVDLPAGTYAVKVVVAGAASKPVKVLVAGVEPKPAKTFQLPPGYQDFSFTATLPAPVTLEAPKNFRVE